MTNNTATDIQGSIHVRDGVGVVHMAGTYDTDIDDLWSALTEPDRLARWAATVAGDLRAGGSFTTEFTSGWEGPGRIDVCDAPHRLLVTLNPGEDDETTIEAVLTADGDATHLVVEERGFPLDELAAHGAGWQAHVEDLAAVIAGKDRGDWHQRWTELAPSYREKATQII